MKSCGKISNIIRPNVEYFTNSKLCYTRVSNQRPLTWKAGTLTATKQNYILYFFLTIFKHFHGKNMSGDNNIIINYSVFTSHLTTV